MRCELRIESRGYLIIKTGESGLCGWQTISTKFGLHTAFKQAKSIYSGFPRQNFLDSYPLLCESETLDELSLKAMDLYPEEFI